MSSIAFPKELQISEHEQPSPILRRSEAVHSNKEQIEVFSIILPQI
jgi:hypothetical protein